MSLLIGGIISAIFGLVSLIFFWSDFITIIKGAFPIFLFLGGALAVYVGIDEIQEKKIEYNINGYANILNGSEVNEDFSLTFFKTLAQLNELDIRILRCYAGYMGDGGESVQDICENTGIDYTQVRFVKEKLSRYGLLQSRNEEINDKNMESMVKYMQDVERESHKSKPKDVKVPKLKKLFGTDSYSITMLGRRYLALMQL